MNAYILCLNKAFTINTCDDNERDKIVVSVIKGVWSLTFDTILAKGIPGCTVLRASLSLATVVDKQQLTNDNNNVLQTPHACSALTAQTPNVYHST